MLDKTETLTPLGERVASMPCDPRLGKVLVLSAMFRCVMPMMCVAACLTRDPFHNSLQNRAEISKVANWRPTPHHIHTARRRQQFDLVFLRPPRWKQLWVAAATVTIWRSSEPCWAGTGYSTRETEKKEMNTWTGFLCRGSAFSSSKVTAQT